MHHAINYAVYQILHAQSDEMMNYLKETKDTVFIKPYCLRFECAALLIEKLLETKCVTFEKVGELTTCTIDKINTGTSRYASMALCLAILDSAGQKETYEEEAHTLVEQHIEDVKQRTAELERRLKEDKW